MLRTGVVGVSWAIRKFRVSRITARLAEFGVQSVFALAPARG